MTHFLIMNISFFFLGPHPQHVEVPRLGIELELQLPAYTTVTSATYITAHGSDRSSTH